MKRWIVILSALLIAQIVLAVAVNLTRQHYGAYEPQAKLLAFDPQAVDTLKIEDGKGSVLLRKKDGKWVLPERADYPVGDSADQLIEKLAGLDKGWPVATTTAAAPRFKVAADAFERQLTLRAGDTELARLYLGTSPGIRKVHARPANEEAIYAVAMETIEASANVDDWIDRRILALEADELTRVELPGVVLERTDDTWRVLDLGAEQQTDAEEAHVLASKAAGLEIQALLGTEPDPEYRQEQPELEMTLARRDGTQFVYRFSRPENENFWVLRRSDFPYFFKVADYAVKPLKEASREQLIRTPDTAAPQPGINPEDEDHG